ncbi:ORF104 fusion protein [Bovine papular stomatitis virus]|uniref:ORF104 fusion protein n=1 Tax=Bovine papular stomatitis virus TaxID=129727 RepID=Q6TV84_9POXV|nr:ORF104 fusion protein [Bovine papular stomatitis virus]AAR98461.1 ORF104 fusion protein [Bovine papular stomatitis virus]
MDENDGENLLGTGVNENDGSAVYTAGAPSSESVEERLVSLLDNYKTITDCCRETGARLDRLERHLESLRTALLNLNTKIDVQTGYSRYY